MADFKRIIIAKGGYLKTPVTEVLELNRTDKEIEEEEFESFEEYCEYTLEEACAVYEQKFAKCVVLTEEDYETVKQLYHVE
jgi:hypothetical protein